MNKTRNIRIFLIGRVGILGIIVIPVYAKWVNSGMGLAEILLLQAIFGVVRLLFEYPSGVLADYFERRTMLVMSSFMVAVGSLAYMLSNTFWGFVLAETFYGISFATRSGTDTAFVYDTLVEHGSESEAKRVLSSGSVVMMVSSAVTLSLSSVLSEIMWSLPFLIAILVSLSTSGMFLLTYEPERHKSGSMTSIVQGSFDLFRNSVFLRVLLLFGVTAISLRIVFWAYIPKFREAGISDVYHGVVLAGANLVAAAVSMWYGRNKKDSPLLVTGVLLSAVLGVVLFTLQGGVPVLLIAIGLHQLARGVINPYISVVLNHEVSSEIRASAESLRGVTIDAFFLVFSGVFSILGLDQATILNANVGIVLALVSLYTIENRRGRSRIPPLSTPV